MIEGKTKSNAVTNALKNMKYITKFIENLGWQPTIIDANIPEDEDDVQITCMMSSPSRTGMVAKIRYELTPRGYNAMCTCSEVNGKIHRYGYSVLENESSAEAVYAAMYSAMYGGLEDLAI